MHNLKNKSILLRYMGSFLVVLLLPMTFLCSFFIHNLNQLLERQTQEMKMVYFNEASEQITKLLNGIFDRAYQISLNDSFGRYRLTDQIKYGAGIVKELNSSVQICEIADDIFIYTPTLDYAYSSTSTFTRERFVRLITGGSMDERAYSEFLSNMNMRNGHPVYTDRAIYIYYYLPTYTFRSDIYLIFRLNPALIGQKLANGQRFSDSGYGIYGTGKALLFYDGTMNEQIDGFLTGLLTENGGEASFPVSCVLNDGGEKYDVFVNHYPTAGFYYYSISPQNAMVSMVTFRQGFTYLVIFVVFVCGNLLCLFFTYVSYRPIKRLNTRAKEVLDRLDENAAGTGNELDIIQTALRSLQSSLDAFPVSGDIRKTAVRQFLIRNMLLGRADDLAAVANGLTQLGITADTEFVLAGILLLMDETAGGKEQVTQEYLSFLENFSNEEITVYAIAGANANQIDLLLTLEKDDIRQYQNFFTALKEQFTQRFGMIMTIGLGSVYPELKLVSISYMQAAQKITGRRLKDDGRILYDMDEAEGSRFYQQIKNYFPRFTAAVRDCIPGEAVSLIRKMQDAIIDSDMQISEVQFLSACILESLVSSFYNYDFEIDGGFYKRYPMSGIEKITTSENLRRFLDRLSADMLAIMNDELEKKDRELKKKRDFRTIVERIKDYIDQNLTDQQLSITGISNEFGVSASYICRIFKEKNGITVLEYINSARICLAKSLLAKSDLTVEAIVREIGFVNASSFIRKFSGVVGMTPGKYRENQRQVSSVDGNV